MFDIILIIVLAMCTIYGLVKGVLQAVFGIFGIIIGIIIASRTFEPLANTLPWDNQISKVCAFIIIFLLVAICINLIGVIVRKIVKFIRLKWLDKLIGGIFGLLIGGLICGLITLATGVFQKGKEVVKSSKVAPYVLKEIEILKGLFPSHKIFIKKKTPAV